MKYSSEIFKYLNDSKFSNGLEISFNESCTDESRISKIINLCIDKKVIHFGFADHIELIEHKIKNNKWLHKQILKVSKQCVGIDIDQESVEYIKTNLLIDNIYCLDIEKEKPDFLTDQRWDLLVLGEIIEHVDNPVQFLTKIRSNFCGCTNKIVITAPNVFNINTIKDIRNNIENINTNHNYWFSPYTLARVVHRSGFSNIEFTFADRLALPLHKKVIHRIRKLFGITSIFQSNQFGSIIMVADFDS